MNRQVFFISLAVLVIVAAAAAFYHFHSRASAPDAASCDGLRIAALGDSLVYGYGAQTQGGFVSMLSARVGTPIANYGVNGNTTADALDRMGQVTATQPDVVLVLLGGNDALQKVPQAQTQQNLSSIIQLLQDAHARVVLIGVLGGFPVDPYQGMFQSLAKAHAVSLVPNVLSGLVGHSDLMSDEVHPNEAGYQKVADKVAPALLSACAATKAAKAAP